MAAGLLLALVVTPEGCRHCGHLAGRMCRPHSIEDVLVRWCATVANQSTPDSDHQSDGLPTLADTRRQGTVRYQGAVPSITVQASCPNTEWYTFLAFLRRVQHAHFSGYRSLSIDDSLDGQKYSLHVSAAAFAKRGVADVTVSFRNTALFPVVPH